MHVTIWGCGVLLAYGFCLIVAVELLVYCFYRDVQSRAGAVTHTSSQRLHAEILLSYAIILMFGSVAVMAISSYVGFALVLLSMAGLPLYVLHRGMWVLRRRNVGINSRAERTYIGFVAILWVAWLVQYFSLIHDSPLSLKMWLSLFFVMAVATFLLYMDCKRRYIHLTTAVNPASLYL